jgi:phage recombination protein Bet
MTDTQTVEEATEQARQEKGPELPAGSLALRDDQTWWDPAQRAALAVLGVKGATNADLALYFDYCRRTGLDPFAKQIYMIQRRERQGQDWVYKQSIQVSIDGFRLIRDRAERRDKVLAEFEDTVWYDKDHNPYSEWLEEEPPVGCKVVLVKHHLATGVSARFPAVLRTAAYMPTRGDPPKPTGQWRPQADHMIEKCCEAFASRRGFPQDLGGLFIEEEMSGVVAGEVEGPPDLPDRPAPPRRAESVRGAAARKTGKGRGRSIQGRLMGMFKDAGLDPDSDGDREDRLLLTGMFANPDGPPLVISSTNDLTDQQVSAAVDTFATVKQAAFEQGRDLGEVLAGMVDMLRSPADTQPAQEESTTGEDEK